MYLFSTKSPTAKTGPLISANNSYSFSYKMGKGAKGKEGKPCIRPKKHAQAGPTVKRTAAKLVINPDKPKCPDDINQEHGPTPAQPKPSSFITLL